MALAEKTEPDKPWAFLPIKAPPQVKAFFFVAVVSSVSNGKNTHFWTDRWLLGQSFEHSLPHLFNAMSARAKGRTVYVALSNRRWVSDLKGALTINVLLEYLQLWGLLDNVELQPDIEDTHIWQFSSTVSTLQNQLMKLFLLVPFNSVRGNEYGKVGHLASANSLCGELLTRNVGRLIA
jgi:hypothetical protein